MNGDCTDEFQGNLPKDDMAELGDETMAILAAESTSHEILKKTQPYGAKILSCSQCKKKFATRFGLKCHFDSHHLGIKYFCPVCKKSARTRSDLNQHIKSVHLGLKHQCPHCDHLSTRTSDLGRHIRATHLGIRYPCPNCHYVATQKRCLKLHINHKHLGIRIPCPSCPYSASSSSALGVHIRTRHVSLVNSSKKSSEERQEIILCCHHCGFGISRKSFLKKHIQLVHFQKCRECKFKTLHKDELETHISNLHPNFILPENEICESERLCPNKNVPEDSKDSKLVDQVCLFCGYQANSLYDLVDHVRIEHQEEGSQNPQKRHRLQRRKRENKQKHTKSVERQT